MKMRMKMKMTYESLKKRLKDLLATLQIYRQICLEFIEDLKTFYQTVIKFKENLKTKYRDIKNTIQEKVALNYLKLLNIYNKTYEKLFKNYNNIIEKYRSLPNTDPYKKTVKFIQHLFKNLATLHQKTLVAAIVKFIFLFRKYYKK